MKKLAIIPARGGSKRIPRKNIKDFLGKPIIAYSIEAALASGLFDEVMVSTDDHEIAEVAVRYGAKVPFLRSQKTADDFATTVEVLIEVLEDYDRIKFKSFDYGCCIYPTAPFVTIQRLREGFEKLYEDKLDSVFPVVAFSSPIWRGLEFIEDGMVKMLWPENLNKRSQDLKMVFHDAGQWYWFNTINLYENKSFFSLRTGAIKLSEIEVQDIDTITDWKIAELKFEVNKA